MKKKVIISLASFILLVSIFSLIYFSKVIYRPFKNTEGGNEFEVKNGDTLYGIINKLDEYGKLKSGNLIKFYIRGKKLAVNSLKPGTYIINPQMSLNQFIDELKYGIIKDDRIKVTIPEGYTIEDIGNVLEKKGVISKKDFISGCKKYALPQYIKNDSKRKYMLEGFLFPDTYKFKKGASADSIIETMLNRFDVIVDEIQKKDGKNINSDDIDDIVTMASILEKEIKTPSELSKASSVFYNRLKIGMKFQSCATIEYAIGYHKDKLYDKDLKVNSPYNTYMVKGYPEGPICCPGKAAIEAAINPDKTSYLYFVSKNDGTHFFTSSYSEFSKAKAKYQGGK